MKLLNEEQVLGVKHGIELGFIKGGMTLSEREKLIVGLTIDSLIEMLEIIMKSE
jgi:hypothetical protein